MRDFLQINLKKKLYNLKIGQVRRVFFYDLKFTIISPRKFFNTINRYYNL